MLADFYSITAEISFALLGLWWVVVQFRERTWLEDPVLRRRAYQISLLFLLPGVMSLASLASERLTWLWQVGFGLAGVVGVVETIRGLRQPLPGDGRLMQLVGVLTLVLYLVITVVAVAPKLPKRLGLDVAGREVEAIAISLLLFLGTTLVWRMFARDPSVGSSAAANESAA